MPPFARSGICGTLIDFIQSNGFAPRMLMSRIFSSTSFMPLNGRPMTLFSPAMSLFTKDFTPSLHLEVSGWKILSKKPVMLSHSF